MFSTSAHDPQSVLTEEVELGDLVTGVGHVEGERAGGASVADRVQESADDLHRQRTSVGGVALHPPLGAGSAFSLQAAQAAAGRPGRSPRGLCA